MQRRIWISIPVASSGFWVSMSIDTLRVTLARLRCFGWWEVLLLIEQIKMTRRASGSTTIYSQTKEGAFAPVLFVWFGFS
jgi:hypothetical protein